MKKKEIKSELIFYEKFDEIYKKYLPSKHLFFYKLSNFPCDKLSSPILLRELYFRYQSACHATRVMIYRLSDLESPELRARLLKFMIDDDAPDNGDLHHYQLRRAFLNIGADLLPENKEFSNLEKLQKILDPETAKFVSLVTDLYPKSLGPWCVIENFSDDWMRALMNGLSNCFPSIKEATYFAECFEKGIEEKHAKEALSITGKVLSDCPELLPQTIEGAHLMAIGLDKFWSSLENLLKEHANY